MLVLDCGVIGCRWWLKLLWLGGLVLFDSVVGVWFCICCCLGVVSVIWVFGCDTGCCLRYD